MRWSGSQESAGGAVRTAVMAVLFAFCLASLAADLPHPDVPRRAELLQPQGEVEIRRAGSEVWAKAATNTFLLPGDFVRTGPRSRALVRLSNDSVVRLDERSQVQVKRPSEPIRSAVPRLLRGALYFFHREKTAESQFETPLVSGAIRGTEFQLQVEESGRSSLRLMDGRVELTNALGVVTLHSGEAALVEPAAPPVRVAPILAMNAIQWCLYYPTVLDPDELDLDSRTRSALGESLAAYRAGDIQQALALLPGEPVSRSAGEAVYRAALTLAAGQVRQAEELLAAIPSGAASETRPASCAAALRRLVAAEKFEEAPEAADETLATSLLAESYYRQSRGDLARALETARAATTRAPRFGAAWARCAELEFGFGDVRAAGRAVETALKLAPRFAPVHVVSGYLLAAQEKTWAAQACFERAIALDAALGDAWLGRGLCALRHGHPLSGRDDLLVAAALEPNRSLLRSYLGKALAVGGDPKRALHEMELARQLDPSDPTAPLYAALLLHQQNRVNEAIGELEDSQSLNDNRQLFRSRLLLDTDHAVRGANLALLHRDAGLMDVASREAARAAQMDYANFSAHLYLADAYNSLRDPQQVNLRYETVAFSELLMANLLSPAGAGAFSGAVSAQEYTRLFEREGLGLTSLTDYTSRGDWQQQAVQHGWFGPVSYNVDVSYRSLHGDRPNGDLSALDVGATLKLQMSPQDLFLVRADTADFESGDLRQYYDQQAANPTLRVEEQQQPNLLVGWHHTWSPAAHTLVLGGWLHDDFRLSDGRAFIPTVLQDGGEPFEILLPAFSGFAYEQHAVFNAGTLEVQHVQRLAGHTLVAGVRFQSGVSDTEVYGAKSSPSLFTYPPLAQSVSTDLRRLSVYGYDTWRLLDTLTVVGGVSYDWLDFPENIDLPPVSAAQREKDQVSPKVGLYWQPARDTTVRAAYTRSLGGLYYDNSVRLEPTQIAGFNQAFRSLAPESLAGLTPGTSFETWGLGADQRFPTRTWLGVAGEWLQSHADRQVGAYAVDFGADPANAFPSAAVEEQRYTEPSLTVNLNQLVGRDWAFGARYRISLGELDRFIPALATQPTLGTFAAADSETRAVLQQLQLYALFNAPCGFFAQFEAAWTQQSDITLRSPGLGLDQALAGDDFWQFNGYAGYRFAQRRAELTLGVLNLADTDYRLHPVNLHPLLPRERTLVVRFRFSF